MIDDTEDIKERLDSIELILRMIFIDLTLSKMQNQGTQNVEQLDSYTQEFIRVCTEIISDWNDRIAQCQDQ